MSQPLNGMIPPKISGLLGPQDPPPVIVENSGAPTPFLLVCDHAGRAVPACLDSLGLAADQLARHIACDIGAGDLARSLAAALPAWLARQTYSRLVIDCNRGPGRADLVAEVSDGTEIPGNQGLDGAAVEARRAEIYAPYHAAIAAELDRRAAARRPAALVSIHSFTPVMAGLRRPWSMGVLHEGRSPASSRMLALLRAEDRFEVGDNQPYAMDGIDHTIPTHAIARGLDYLELEIRQDLIADEAGRAPFVELLTRLIPLAFGG